MTSAAYATYLRSDHWRNLTNWLHIRCNAHCEACNRAGADWPIDGHHLFYRARLKDTVLSDLLGLCRRCHDIVHDLKIPELFARGTPVAIIRDVTLREIRRYLPELYPASTGPVRTRLSASPRVVGPIPTRRRCSFHKPGSLGAAQLQLAERQRHLRRT